MENTDNYKKIIEELIVEVKGCEDAEKGPYIELPRSWVENMGKEEKRFVMMRGLHESIGIYDSYQWKKTEELFLKLNREGEEPMYRHARTFSRFFLGSARITELIGRKLYIPQYLLDVNEMGKEVKAVWYEVDQRFRFEIVKM